MGKGEKMKKMVFFCALALLLFLLPACGGDAPAPAPAPATNTAARTIPSSTGEAYVCPAFSMTVAEGWTAGPLNMGMVNVLPKGKNSPGLYFKFEGNGNALGSAEASMENMVKNYNGTAMADVTVSGQVFKRVSYSHGGSSQNMLVAFIHGTKVTLTVEGDGAWENPDIQNMLKSVVLK